MMKKILFAQITLLFLFLFLNIQSTSAQKKSAAYIKILGVAQDGGYPHAGCSKQCCSSTWKNDSLRKYVVSFALIDSITNQWWLFEATPDIKFQLEEFRESTGGKFTYLPQGIFLTHAHIGHYAGLIQFGKEVMSSKEIPVYVLPRFKTFLETNGPWSQLVNLNNIVIHLLKADSVFHLTNQIQIETFIVPHRDEYSETAGFKIFTPEKKYLFIPDIDKWEKWNRDVVKEVMSVDVALIDATFYSNTELPGRAMSEVPHPMVSETMELFRNKDGAVKKKIYFIHFNHTNPLLWDKNILDDVREKGFNIAEQLQNL
jgi:pyrroloquinoline quinone biosynthesis protein B